MNNLKKFYEDVEKNPELKAALVAANKELEGKSLEECQAKLIAIAKDFGYTLTADDFTQAEGELNESDLDAVAGGAGGCFLTHCGCSLFGEIDSTGGCILIGAYV